jgi:hypothetical protein
VSCAGGRSFVISPPTRTPEVSSNGGTQERAHFFDLIEEDELVPSAAKKRDSQRRGNGRLGRPNYPVEASTSPPPKFFFFGLVASFGRSFWNLLGFPRISNFSTYLSKNVSSSEEPILTSDAAAFDPRHRVLGARGRHGLWQGRGGLTSLAGRRNCLHPDRSGRAKARTVAVNRSRRHSDGRERQLGSRGQKGSKPLILSRALCPLVNPSPSGVALQVHWNHYPHRLVTDGA